MSPRRSRRAREVPRPRDEGPISSESRIEACRRKRRFETEREADDAAYLVRMEGGSLGYYRCDVCGGWHLTSRERGQP